MNTGEADMDVIGERTPYVFGRSVAAGGAGNPARPTAVGVFHGIRASLFHAFGSDSFEGRAVLLQGAGGVGSELGPRLAEAGASVLIADLDSARAQSLATQVDGAVVPIEQVFETRCDVFAPCAIGGILTTETASRLRCRIVAGSANNQLADPEAAEMLWSRGILYAPDYVINVGGAIGTTGPEQFGWGAAELDAALTRIGETLLEIYRRAEQEDLSTAAAADAFADEHINGHS